MVQHSNNHFINDVFFKDELTYKDVSYAKEFNIGCNILCYIINVEKK